MWATGERTLVHGAALAVVAFWCLSATALASFPGRNGSIAFSTLPEEALTTDIATVQPDGSGLTNPTGGLSGNALDPAWSPDGSRIAFILRQGIELPVQSVRVMNEDGTGIVPVDDPASEPRDPSWAPNGTTLAWTDLVPEGSLAVPAIVSKDVGEQGDPTPLLPKPAGTTISGLAWSPDGRKIAYVWTYRVCTVSCGPTVSQLEVFDVSSRIVTPLGNVRGADPEDPRGDVAWSPDGNQIAVSLGPGDLRIVSARDGEHVTTIVDADTEGSPYTSNSGNRVAWSPDGSQLVFVGDFQEDSDREDRLVLVSPTGDGASEIASVEVARGGIDWQPLQPPVTTITSAPAAVTTDRSARFEFVASKRPVTFECRLDDRPWESCASGIEYTGLPSGSHEFAVRATESHGLIEERPPQHAWRVESTPQLNAAPEQPFSDRTGIRARWFRHVVPAHRVEFRSLRAVRVPSGATIEVRCKGPGCPPDFQRRVRTRRFRKSKQVLGGLRGRFLEPRAAVFVTITKPGYIGIGKMYCVRYNRPVRVRPFALDGRQPTCGPAARGPG